MEIFNLMQNNNKRGFGFVCVRVFTSVGAKSFVYFKIKTYFFLFHITTLQNTPHQIIYFTQHFIGIHFMCLERCERERERERESIFEVRKKM